MKYSLDKLYSIAVIFEKSAEDSLSDQRLIDDLLDHDLLYLLKETLEINISPETFAQWVKNNKSVLSQVRQDYWQYNYNYSEGGMVSHLDNAVAKITQSRIDRPEWTENKSAILQRYDNIPTLYLSIGNEAPDINIPKTLGHDLWFIEALRKLFHATIPGDLNEINECYEKSRPTIERIKKFFRVTAPTILGRGVDGIAFDIGEGRVLKIFKDDTSFNHAYLAYKRLHEQPDLAKTEAMIYDVGQFADYEGYDFFYYIMEKMTPINDSSARESIKFIAMEVATFIKRRRAKFRSIKEYIRDPKQTKIVANFVNSKANEIAERIRDETPDLIDDIENTFKDKLNNNWLEYFIEEIIMKYMTGRTDLHMGNLGLTGYGRFIYFDPAYSEWESKININ